MNLEVYELVGKKTSGIRSVLPLGFQMPQSEDNANGGNEEFSLWLTRTHMAEIQEILKGKQALESVKT